MLSRSFFYFLKFSEISICWFGDYKVNLFVIYGSIKSICFLSFYQNFKSIQFSWVFGVYERNEYGNERDSIVVRKINITWIKLKILLMEKFYNFALKAIYVMFEVQWIRTKICPRPFVPFNTK